ncbi:TonB-dependent siderophore receptor [Methylobacillus gramineus]|uniref:TonB-dependent siderophore receptor n=1 Tax=Methylobacillus gramineus TaxID=755169 RepID=UPI001CFF95CF|nr:TonB-dependent siderophore receptor [Methylobacillus gramineus]MCB5184752.1 TonB-dependent siderophore receptor [Methylobacillus gramineus]
MFKKVLLAGGYACAQFGAGMAFAEDTSGQEQLPEIRIQSERQTESATAPFNGYKANRAQSATKTNASLNETAQSISVIGSEQIRDQGAQSLAEALRSVAGVDAGQRGRRGLDDFSIRGFVQSDYVLRDGMRMSYDLAWIQAEPFGLERIEVLKGPASVLYGQTGPGGFVNLVSKRPTDKPIAQIGFGLGNYQQKQVTADFSDALNQSGSVRYRLVAASSASDDQVDFVDRQRTYVAPSLTWDISDNTSLTILTSYQKSQYVPVRGLPAAGTILPNRNGNVSFSRFIGFPGIDKYTTEQTLFGYEFSHAFNDNLQFKQNLRYNTLNLNGWFAEADANSLAANQRDYTRRLSYRNLSAQMWTIDNQLSAKFSTGAVKHNVLLGMDTLRFYLNREYAQQANGNRTAINLFNPVYSAPRALAVTPASTGSDELTQYGLYLQDLIKFGDGWNLQLGLRRDESEITQKRINGSNTKTDPGKTTAKAGLLYAFDNGWSPYVSYSESFVPLTGSTFDGSPFKPETGKQNEIGIKYESNSKRFGATFALYDLKRQNISTTDPANSGFNIQTGEQRHKGLEIEATGQVTDYLNLVASYTYVDAEVTKSTTATLGKRPILVAKNMANIWATYDLVQWLPGLSVGAGARYIGEQAGDANNTFNVPHYTLFDAALYYNTGAWRFALNARNLADKEYVAGCASIGACYTGDPRMVMLTANYSFK